MVLWDITERPGLRVWIKAPVSAGAYFLFFGSVKLHDDVLEFTRQRAAISKCVVF
jgi:hypothetical protein